MRFNKFLICAVGVWIGLMLMWLAFWAAIIYAAIHFASKYW